MIKKHVAGKTIVIASASNRHVEIIELATCRISVLEAVSSEITSSNQILERMKAEDETRKAS
jgi:hypothetical protein